jgi:5-dehydro-2-deoxygluconokinase
VITRTGADPFGEFLHDALHGFGVDDRYVTPVPDLPTPVVHVETDPLVTAPSSESCWDVPVAQVADLDATRDARKNYAQNKSKQRLFL